MREPNLIRQFGVLLAACALAVGCAGRAKTVRGTSIEATADNEQIIDVLERYRERMQRRDAPGILALVSPNYHEDSGTPGADDDYGYDQLKQVLTDRLGRLRSIRYGLEYRKINVRRTDPKRPVAEVDVYIDASFQLASNRDGGQDRYKRVTEYNRVVLEHDGKRWLIIQGL